MAIAVRATGSWTDSTANLTVTIPTAAAAPQAGDLMVIFYGTKPYNDAPTIDQSWIDAGAATDGTTAAGTDTGSMQARIFYKIHTGTESNPTITNATNNVSSAVMVVFSKAPYKNWSLTFAGAGMGTASTSFSAASGNVNLAPNDVIASFVAIRSDAGSPSSVSLTATGITFAAFDPEPNTAYTTTTGGDMAAISGFSRVTAGTATTPVTFACTLAASHSGSWYSVRIREIDQPGKGKFFQFLN